MPENTTATATATTLDLTDVADGDPVSDHGDPSIDPGIYGLDLTLFDPGDGDGDGDGLDAPSEPEDVADGVADTAPAVPATAPPAAPAANLVGQLHRRIVRARKILRSRHSEYLDAKEEAKAAKERFSAAQTDLNGLIGDLCKAVSGDGQLRLPLVEDEDPEDDAEDDDFDEHDPMDHDERDQQPCGPTPIPAATGSTDPAKSTPLSALAPHGLTESKAEKLAEADVHTVADLEACINSGKLLKIKGIGEKAVDKIEDAVLAWREQNPAPDEPA